MKGTRHSEEQIIAILKRGDAGVATADLCRQHGISEQTYCFMNDDAARQHAGAIFSTCPKHQSSRQRIAIR